MHINIFIVKDSSEVRIMDALKWLWGYVKKYKLSLFFNLIFSGIIISCILTIPIILGRIVDNVIMAEDKSLLLNYCIGVISFALISEIGLYSRHLILENTSQNVVKEIRNKLYNKLQELDCSYFDKTRKGDIMSRLTMDTDAIRILLAGTIPTITDQIVYIIIGLTIMFSTNILLTFLLISTAPFIGFFAYHLARNIKLDFIKMRESNSHLNTVVAENIAGNRVVKAYAKEDYEIKKFEEKNEEYKKAFIPLAKELRKNMTP